MWLRGVVVSSMAAFSLFHRACVLTLWSCSVVWAPYAFLASRLSLPCVLTREVASAISVLICSRVCSLFSLQFLTYPSDLQKANSGIEPSGSLDLLSPAAAVLSADLTQGLVLIKAPVTDASGSWEVTEHLLHRPLRGADGSRSLGGGVSRVTTLYCFSIGSLNKYWL